MSCQLCVSCVLYYVLYDDDDDDDDDLEKKKSAELQKLVGTFPSVGIIRVPIFRSKDLIQLNRGLINKGPIG